MVGAVTDLDAKAEESILGGEDVDLPRGLEAWRALAGAFGQGRVVARTAARLGGELAKIAVGRSACGAGQGRPALCRPGVEHQSALPPD